MKSKQIIILGIIFVILILGVCVKELHKPTELSKEEYTSLQFSFDPPSVEKILIAKGPEKSVELMKENGQWKIPGLWNARADEQQIENFLKDIWQAKGEIRANDLALLGDFGLGNDQAFSVSLFEGGEELTARFLIGSQRADAGFVFLRFENSNTVYLAQADLLTPMKLYGELDQQKPSQDAWVDLKPFHFDPSKVTKLEAKRFQNGKEKKGKKENLTLMLEAVTTGDKKEWRSLRKDESIKIVSQKVEEFLFSLTNVQATNVLDPAAFGFEKPVWQMTLTLGAGKEIIVKAIRQDPESSESSYFILQVSTEPVLFQISKHYFETLDISHETLS